MRNAFPFALTLLAAIGAQVAPASAGKVLVLPLAIDTSRIHDSPVVQDFFFEAVERFNNGDAVRGKDSLCTVKECAADRRKAENAEQVIYGAVRFLGRKCFFSGSILGADGVPFTQTITVLSVADFENATKRMAESLLRRVPIEKSADIENITDREQLDPAANRRHSFYSMGGSIGYLYPFSGSFQRWTEGGYDYTCAGRDSLGNCPDRLQKYSQMVVLSFDNWFEFRPDLAMALNVQWVAPLAFGVDVNMDYLAGKGDFTPFLGGGLGLHYVGADEGKHEDTSKRNSGPTLNVEGGMIFFRTFTTNLVAKAMYQVILNSDVDQGAGAMLGIRTKF